MYGVRLALETEAASHAQPIPPADLARMRYPARWRGRAKARHGACEGGMLARSGARMSSMADIIEFLEAVSPRTSPQPSEWKLSRTEAANSP